MLRLLVLLLVLVNAAYFAWAKNLLAPYGFAPTTQSEPQRIGQQIRPEAMRITVPPQAGTPPAAQAASAPASSSGTPASTTLTTTPASNTATVSTPLAAASRASAPAVASGPAECLQVGLFNEEQTVVLRDRLQSVLPPSSWVLENIVEPGRWMVYMGKYSDAEALEKKRSELRRLRVSFEPLANPSLEPGLSLGSFPSKTEADAQMARIAKQGVRTAKVIQTANEVRGQKLRLPAVDAVLRPQLEAIRPLLAGKQLKTC
ncbi:MAG: SPOR domain-containing protein [Pseudomonadota bacterium]